MGYKSLKLLLKVKSQALTEIIPIPKCKNGQNQMDKAGFPTGVERTWGGGGSSKFDVNTWGEHEGGA